MSYSLESIIFIYNHIYFFCSNVILPKYNNDSFIKRMFKRPKISEVLYLILNQLSYTSLELTSWTTTLCKFGISFKQILRGAALDD